jgi:hypothetical protein
VTAAERKERRRAISHGGASPSRAQFWPLVLITTRFLVQNEEQRMVRLFAVSYQDLGRRVRLSTARGDPAVKHCLQRAIHEDLPAHHPQNRPAQVLLSKEMCSVHCRGVKQRRRPITGAAALTFPALSVHAGG